jgi:hypothetical protein
MSNLMPNGLDQIDFKIDGVAGNRLILNRDWTYKDPELIANEPVRQCVAW